MGFQQTKINNFCNNFFPFILHSSESRKCIQNGAKVAMISASKTPSSIGSCHHACLTKLGVTRTIWIFFLLEIISSFCFYSNKKQIERCMFSETNGGTNPMRMIKRERENETELRNRIAIFFFVRR